MSLRILYHHRIRADDGQAVHVRELIAALRRAGHEVRECALVRKADGSAAARDRRPSFWQRVSLPRAATEVLEVLYNRRGRQLLRAAARGFAPHMVYERHALHCRVGLDVARELSVPLLLEVNSPMVDEMQKLAALRLPARARRTEHAVLAGADRVLAVTAVLADRLVRLGARRQAVRIVQNGAQPERYGEAARVAARAVRASWNLPTNAFALGFIGFMRPWHRLDLVLDVMARPALGAVHLVLMGQGPALPALLAMAAQRGVAARIHALGTIAPDRLPAHVCAVDATLIPAINDYASPLKLFDALAAGVPVLAPDQANLRELVTDGQDALLFAPFDAEALAARLGQLVRDRALGPKLGQAGHRTLLARQYTWDGNAARIAAIVAELQGGRS